MRADKLDVIHPSIASSATSSLDPSHSTSTPVDSNLNAPSPPNSQNNPANSRPTKQPLEPSTFVERILQEGSVNRLFAQNTFDNLNRLIIKAKETMIKFLTSFETFRLPSYRDDLLILANFAPSLMQEVLRIRLQNVKLLRSDLTELPPVLLQQLTDDFRTSLTHATAIKKFWMEIMKAETNWDMCLPDAEHTEVVEGEWGFLKSAVAEIEGGDVLLGEHYRLSARKVNVPELVRWNELILSSLRQRHRKVLRFSRTILSRFENSAEYALERYSIDLSFFVGGLNETNHFLIIPVTSNEMESISK
ncbi:hypothetical protein KEM48_000778 [Puccinia striiformis f. sp. tritici PST-130]|nr:hypothetical protein KEM48_000778 [Puccinia striiformis f. sp. tritici PST-130]